MENRIAKEFTFEQKKQDNTLKKKKKDGRCVSLLKVMDMYGQPIQLTFEGDNQYKTTPGSIVSIVVILVCLVYAAQRAIILVMRQQPIITTSTLQIDDINDQYYNPFLDGFQIAFGLLADMDPSIGKTQAFLLRYDYGAPIVFEGYNSYGVYITEMNIS